MPADYLFDTDVCIDLIRGRGSSKNAGSVALASSAISSISLAELEFGVAKSSSPESSRRKLAVVVESVEVLGFDAAAARHYGEIRCHLEAKGMTIGPMDLLIAAHARSLGATLVTANLREFRRVPGLRCLAWR